MHDWFPFIYDEDAPRSLLDSIQNHPALGSDSSSLTDFTVLIYIFSLETSVNYLGIELTSHAVR